MFQSTGRASGPIEGERSASVKDNLWSPSWSASSAPCISLARISLGLLRRSVDFGNRAPVVPTSFQSTSSREVDP